MRMALSRFWNWLRSCWHSTTVPVGLWMSRTAEEVLLMCWPPAPLERQACISMSSGRISISLSSSSSGMTSTAAKLAELKLQQHAEKISDIKGVQMKIEWGSQIRSYVFMPYQMVKDTRTSYETSNIDAVMDGDLDGFINAYLTQLATGELTRK